MYIFILFVYLNFAIQTRNTYALLNLGDAVVNVYKNDLFTNISNIKIIEIPAVNTTKEYIF